MGGFLVLNGPLTVRRPSVVFQVCLPSGELLRITLTTCLVLYERSYLFLIGCTAHLRRGLAEKQSRAVDYCASPAANRRCVAVIVTAATAVAIGRVRTISVSP